MARKGYSVYCGRQCYNIGLGGSNFVPISDVLEEEANKWFDVKVTSWDDGDGYITGTYEFANVPERIQRAMESNNLYIAIARKEASRAQRGTTEREWGYKMWHIDPTRIFMVEGSSGTFSLYKPGILDSSSHASYGADDPYQIVQLTVVKMTSPDSGMFNKFIPIPNTKHTFYY